MGFVHQVPRIIAREIIEQLAGNRFGVYGIFNFFRCIYVGKGDIRSRLLTHIASPQILSYAPTHWVAELTPLSAIREKQLILELQPLCNQRLG